MSNIIAAIGCAQIEDLNKIIEKKRYVANRYNEALSKFDDLDLPIEQSYAYNVYWVYHIICTKKLLGKSKQITSIQSTSQGYVKAITSMTLAEISRNHGAGRFAMEDTITPEIGFEILVEQGQAINQGQTWIKFHHNIDLTAQEKQSLAECITISSRPITSKPRLIEIIITVSNIF